MTEPVDSSRPRLAHGCQWGGTAEDRLILFPEGALRLEGPGQEILEQCDGENTFEDIVERLADVYAGSDPVQMRKDVSIFLEQLQLKRIVDY